MNMHRYKILMFLLLSVVCFAGDWIGDDLIFRNNGEGIIWKNNSQTVYVYAHPSASESYEFVLPAAKGTAGQALIIDSIVSDVVTHAYGTPSTSAAHNILSATHSDATTASIVQGDVLYGFANGDLRRLAIGAALGGTATTYFGGDGTDVGYRTLAQMLDDLSGEATGSFDWNNQGITNVKLGSLTTNGFVKTGSGDGTLSVDPNEFFTQEETLELIAGGNFNFFLNDTASGVGAYYTMALTPTGEAESTFSDEIASDDFLIDSFITPADEPTFTTISAGIYSLHFHADVESVSAAVDTIKIYYKFYEYDADTTETLIATSEYSDILTETKTVYNIHCIHGETTIESDDRFLIKIYAKIEDDNATNADVNIYAEGTNATSFSVNTTIDVFDERYVEITGDTMTGELKIDHISEKTAGHGVAVGLNALLSITTGTKNYAFGNNVLRNVEDGGNNNGFGDQVFQRLIDGGNNNGMGRNAGFYNLHGDDNTLIGHFAGFGVEDGSYSRTTCLGCGAGRSTEASGGVFLGCESGYYETAANKLFIDNAKRANEADARVKALIYGFFDANTANQFVTINGALNILHAATVASLDAGSGTIQTTGAITDGTFSVDAGVMTGIASLNGAGTIDLEDNLDGTGFTITASDIIASLGAVATPSHTFTGDLNTGMWSSAADTLNFSTGGTERLEIDSSEATFTVPINTGANDITTTGTLFADEIQMNTSILFNLTTAEFYIAVDFYDDANFQQATLGATNNFSADVSVTGDFISDGNTGLSATYNFGGGGSGDIATMTFTGGILTSVTTVP